MGAASGDQASHTAHAAPRCVITGAKTADSCGVHSCAGPFGQKFHPVLNLPAKKRHHLHQDTCGIMLTQGQSRDIGACFWREGRWGIVWIYQFQADRFGCHIPNVGAYVRFFNPDACGHAPECPPMRHGPTRGQDWSAAA
mgnify:CR=1 FL=1